MPKTRWRGYLRGRYKVTNENLLNELHFDIRKRAKRMMMDLLLIIRSNRLPERQKILIFRNLDDLDFWKTTIKPLIRELMNKSCVLSPNDEEFEELQYLARGLYLNHIKFDAVRLITDKTYRDQKEVQLKSKLSC